MSNTGKFGTLHYKLGQLIKYYYEELGNSAGGILHVVLDDGNTDHETILFCKREAEKAGDTFAIFLCDLMLAVPESSLDTYFELGWPIR